MHTIACNYKHTEQVKFKASDLGFKIVFINKFLVKVSTISLRHWKFLCVFMTATVNTAMTFTADICPQFSCEIHHVNKYTAIWNIQLQIFSSSWYLVANKKLLGDATVSTLRIHQDIQSVCKILVWKLLSILNLDVCNVVAYKQSSG